MASGLIVRILAVVSIVLIVLAAIGWIVFLGGFGYQTNDTMENQYGKHYPSGTPVITGPLWDPYWVVSVLSPFLFIVMIAKAILMIINDEQFRKYYIIHFLAVLAFIMTVIVLCFLGAILYVMRFTIQRDNEFNITTPSFINALFAGTFLELLFLGGAWICHILAHLFGGPVGSYNKM